MEILKIKETEIMQDIEKYGEEAVLDFMLKAARKAGIRKQ